MPTVLFCSVLFVVVCVTCWHVTTRRQGEDKWSLESNGKAVKSYGTDDLRMTIVYR